MECLELLTNVFAAVSMFSSDRVWKKSQVRSVRGQLILSQNSPEPDACMDPGRTLDQAKPAAEDPPRTKPENFSEEKVDFTL